MSEREIFVSFKNFALHPSILQSIEHCGYTTATPIQTEAIPKALEGKDLIASANTGTGKTAAFVLPILNSIAKHSSKKKQAGHPSNLILTPTRELATQVSQAINKYGKKLRFTSISLLGGMPYGPQLKNLSRPVDIVVATPGRLIDHIERGRINLSNVKMLVLDEADRMLDMGFVTEVNKIADATAKDRQTLLFTATWDKKMAQLAQRLLTNPERIQVETEVTQENIDQRLHIADDAGHKNRLLHHILDDENLKQAIIFSSTKRGADDLAHSLRNEGYAASALHGDMKQGARNRALTNMRRGKLRFLVATDVAARGIDVTGISHVINFDLPRFAEDYVHRIGRTGRAGAEGTAISFALPDDMRHLERIERYTGQSVPRYIIEGLEPTRKLQQKARNKKRKFRSGNNSGVARKKNYSSASRKPSNQSHSRRR